MVKHIVLFKFKSFESAEEKEQKLKYIQSQLLNLKNIIKEIATMEVGLNGNPKEAFDLALVSTHKSWEDLAVYDQHPDHVAVKKIIKEVLDTRSAADFEF
ncbi:MAG: Dabb family protein [Paludibacteraceae bacterium]|nr:Dabb family protein [Paludibacteraceae bacterium]MBR6041774.1 Dabb family protein [Paludibacteraceae bacterium]MCR5567887.1 Dabb family protein [Paludibacteraceae bacterium]